MERHQQHQSSQPNRLIHEKSPYLLQHAHNPVNWFAWTDEAFAQARLQDKPIFLSIGYSTCHWCHVMAKESFENEAVAAILNASFIAVKVDREERPDIDQIYMIATQAMTGGGGWPMSVFLFADKKPFYAGTYFPPEPRHNHPGFPDLLNAIARAWTENKKALAESAEHITAYLESSSTTEVRQHIKESWSDSGYTSFKEIYDTRFYGFGTGNKFPRPVSLDFLLHYAHRSGSAAALRIVENTLSAMAAGGIYDHIGGGFHRYAVDRQWRIPHFEKMLYDQAQLCVTYLHMYQQTGNTSYADTARETLDYVLRDMQHAEGGLYSAEDADSINPYDSGEHGEGAYYLWKKSEIDKLLGAEEGKIFAHCYGISDDGNALQDPAGEFTGRNILYLPRSLEESAAQLQLTTAEVRAALDESKEKLLAHRMQRTRPHLDDKVIAAWNGLMISALSKAGQILESDRYLVQAQRVSDFVLTNLSIDHELKRRWRGGEARFDAVLEDYAFFIQGLLDLYSACHQSRYLKKALELSEKQLELFLDPAGGFFNSRASAGLLTRIKESYDGAEPSGNSVSAVNFLRLGRLLHKTEWIALATGTIRAFGRVFEENGTAMPQLLTALELYLQPQRLLIVAGKKDADDTREFLRQANRFFLPGLQVILADGEDNQIFLLPFIDVLATAGFQGGRAKAYLCTNHVCSLPTSDASDLAGLLKEQTTGQPIIEDVRPGDQDKQC